MLHKIQEHATASCPKNNCLKSNYGLEGSIVKFEKFLTFSDFHLYQKNLVWWQFLHLHIIFMFFYWADFYWFCRRGVWGAKAPRKFWSFFRLFFHFFEGDTGAKPPKLFRNSGVTLYTFTVVPKSASKINRKIAKNSDFLIKSYFFRDFLTCAFQILPLKS